MKLIFNFSGRWGGSVIEFTDNEGIMYSIETVDGVRGFNIPVTVRYDEGKWKAFHKGDELELKAVYQYEKKQIQ